ncbi:MAG TPA: hypothetical protein VG621_01785 [Candidatus Paceibacterota bacterium]|nr:hypothetical protein [Candidatus Paceibacterota bacterium]
MEEFKPEQQKIAVEIPKEIFKEKKIYEVESLLRGGNIKAEDFYELAKIAALDSEEIFDKYHNLFSIYREKSKFMIETIKEHYEEQLKQEQRDWLQQKLEKKIKIAQAFIDFLNKYDQKGAYMFAWNAKTTLEEALK